MIESEKVLERKLVDKIKKLGGHAYKFVSPNQRGVPDRLCVLPHGITVFVELKTTGKKPTKLQELCMGELKSLGQECVVVDSSEALDGLINRISSFIKALEPSAISAKELQEAIGNYSGRKDLKL